MAKFKVEKRVKGQKANGQVDEDEKGLTTEGGVEEDEGISAFNDSADKSLIEGEQHSSKTSQWKVADSVT